MPKEGSHCICLTVMLIDLAFKIGKNYHLQVFLEEYKCIVEEENVIRFITDDLEISSDDSHKENSDKDD